MSGRYSDDSYPSAYEDYREHRYEPAVPTAESAPETPVETPAPMGRRGRRARRSPRTRWIVWGVVAALLVLCGAGGYVAARPYLAEWPATLSKPEKLAGLELSTEPALQQAANEIAAGIRKDVEVREAIAAFYHDPAAEEKIVALVGGTAFLMSPKAELDEAFRSAGREGMAISNVRGVDPGPLGGLAQCGTAEQQADGGEKIPLSVCAWADHGSLMIGLFFHRPVEEGADLLRRIRTEMLRR